jgi:hypothetical protein
LHSPIFFHRGKKTERNLHQESTEASVAESATIAHVVTQKKFTGTYAAVAGRKQGNGKVMRISNGVLVELHHQPSYK